MKKLDKVGRVFNVILSVIYVPLSLFSWLLVMASEATIGATNPLFITLINIFCFISFVNSLLFFVGIILSVILRNKGYSVPSFVVQFIPLAIFVLNLAFGVFTDFIPAMI